MERQNRRLTVNLTLLAVARCAEVTMAGTHGTKPWAGSGWQ